MNGGLVMLRGDKNFYSTVLVCTLLAVAITVTTAVMTKTKWEKPTERLESYCHPDRPERIFIHKWRESGGDKWRVRVSAVSDGSCRKGNPRRKFVSA